MNKRLTLCAKSPLGTMVALVAVVIVLALYGWFVLTDGAMRVTVYSTVMGYVAPNRSIGVPTGWNSVDLGTSSVPGVTHFNGWSFTMVSGSGDSSLTADHYHYLFTPAPDEFTMSTRINDMRGNLEFNPTAAGIVDLAAETIVIGAARGLADGDPVVYHHGPGGSDIGGLQDGTTYYILNQGGGKIRLYKDAQSAKRDEQSGRIDLTSNGTGTHHSLDGGGNRELTNRAGIMVRENTTAGARFVAIFMTPTQIGLVSRNTTNGTAVSTLAVPNNSGASYLRLVRAGNSYSASYGDGSTWTALAGNLNVPISSPIVGLAVSTRGASMFSARFDDVNLNNVTVSGWPVNLVEGLSIRIKKMSKPQMLVVYAVLIGGLLATVHLAGRFVRSYRYQFNAAGDAFERREMWLFLPAWVVAWAAVALALYALIGPTGAAWKFSWWMLAGIGIPTALMFAGLVFFPDWMAKRFRIRQLKRRVPTWTLVWLGAVFLLTLLGWLTKVAFAAGGGGTSPEIALPAWLVLALALPPLPLAAAWVYLPRLASFRFFIPGFRWRVPFARVKRLEIIDTGDGATELILTLRDERSWALGSGTPRQLQRIGSVVSRVIGLQRQDMATWA